MTDDPDFDDIMDELDKIRDELEAQQEALSSNSVTEVLRRWRGD